MKDGAAADVGRGAADMMTEADARGEAAAATHDDDDDDSDDDDDDVDDDDDAAVAATAKGRSCMS